MDAAEGSSVNTRLLERMEFYEESKVSTVILLSFVSAYFLTLSSMGYFPSHNIRNELHAPFLPFSDTQYSICEKHFIWLQYYNNVSWHRILNWPDIRLNSYYILILLKTLKYQQNLLTFLIAISLFFSTHWKGSGICYV